MIEPLAPKPGSYFNFHGVRCAFLMQPGRKSEARVAFDKAIPLANSAAEAAHIRPHPDRLMQYGGKAPDPVAAEKWRPAVGNEEARTSLRQKPEFRRNDDDRQHHNRAPRSRSGAHYRCAARQAVSLLDRA